MWYGPAKYAERVFEAFKNIAGWEKAERGKWMYF